MPQARSQPFPLPLFPLSPFPLPLSLLLGRRRHLSLIPSGRGGARKSSINRLLADFLRGGGSLRFDRGEAGFIVGERGRIRRQDSVKERQQRVLNLRLVRRRQPDARALAL